MINKINSIKSLKQAILPQAHHIASSFKRQALHNFKMQIGTIHQPFEAHKQNARVYRSVFFGIGLFFLALTLFVYHQNTSWLCGLYFQHCVMAKASLVGTCSFLGTLALFLGFRIKAESEAAAFAFSRARQKLQTLYHHHLAALGIAHFTLWFKKSTAAMRIQHSYHETLHKIHDLREHSVQLMQRIARSKDLDRKHRDHLLNQALDELTDQLDAALGKFEQHPLLTVQK